MKKEIAIQVHKLTICSIENFIQIIKLINPDDMPEEQYLSLRNAAGMLIGRTYADLLEIIYDQYPDLELALS